ncbi:response regulator [Pedobacter ureilyticus]|jgi:CheY-like chemotaxis protein|uniref:Response regulator n=1 Tax=Pedobacter ureilyticus TaxID=1393051 RepID=A0ABW9J163_9SPHI|nr:response regulator [Pedobacter helvus]
MPNRTGKVLLIDDNDIDLKINSKVIKLSDFFDEIILCQSGEEGIEYINKNLDHPELLPDFILLDIQMPEMDGFEFLEIYKHFPKTFLDRCKLAILSSTLDFGDIKKAEANPLVIKLLKKPLYPNELKELLSRNSSLLGI